MARCAVRAASSGATRWREALPVRDPWTCEVATSCAVRSARWTRAGTSRRDVPTSPRLHLRRHGQRHRERPHRAGLTRAARVLALAPPARLSRTAVTRLILYRRTDSCPGRVAQETQAGIKSIHERRPPALHIQYGCLPPTVRGEAGHPATRVHHPPIIQQRVCCR